jgi:hypothetical protein
MKRAMLETVDGVPPNYAEIVAALPRAADDGVMFAYDGKVYGRGIAKVLTRELDAHERVHIERQGADPVGWWKRYVSDLAFRIDEEFRAHRAEYEMYCRRHISPVKRAMFRRKLAERLASPLYGVGGLVMTWELGLQFNANPCEPS